MTFSVHKGGLAAKALLCCAGALLACLLVAAPAAAAPPANNNFASAVTLSTDSLVIASNVEATKQAGEPNHAGDPGGASVWYSWTAPSTGKFLVTTCGSQFDTLLAVYTGSAVNALTEVASNDDAFRCPAESEFVLNATSGVNYKIAVDGFGGDTGDFLVGVFLVTPPSNDSFSTPVDEGGDSDWSQFGQNISATKQAGEPNHAGNAGGASVWYRWTAPITGHYQLDSCDTEFDTLLAVYTGNAVGSLTPIASDDDSCGSFGSYLEFDAVAGTVYRIAVDGFGGAMGNFQLFMHKANPPSNDNFANAQTLSGLNTHVTGNNFDATSEPGEPSGFVAGPLYSVWYSWTAPVSGTATLDTCNSDFDTVLTVFTGNALSALTRVASNDQASNCGFGGSKVILNVNGGTTYKIAVDGYFEQGDIDLRLNLAGTGPTVDSRPPNSLIKRVIVDSEHHRATIKFGSSEQGSSFRCKLDNKPYRSCHSPKTYRNLDEGTHRVKVQARDSAGNLDPSSAVRRFEIEP